jgi:hypothetical protein
MQSKDLTLNLYGQAESVQTEQYVTAKGHRYDVVKIRLNVNGASLELTAREKVIKLTKGVIVGDWLNVTANVVCRYTTKYTFISLDIVNLVNTTHYAN